LEVATPPHRLGLKNRHTVFKVPLWFIEYGLYASLSYASLAPILGIQIDRLGIVFLAGLALLSFHVYRRRSIDSVRFLALPMGFSRLVLPMGLGVSYLILQLIFHGESINSGYVKGFIPWIFTLIVVQAISLRQGFLHRFVIFALLMGIVLLFFLDMRNYGGLTRVGLDRQIGGLSNPNTLAAWYGFCAVYFYLFGINAQRQIGRMVSWVIAIGCLFVVTLTVSRGGLLACLIAMIVGSREFLKRGFVPLLLLLIVAWIVFVMGIFDQAISFYTMRGGEETGRGLIWPRAWENFVNSPWTGLGASNVGIYLPSAGKSVTPHNGFLFIAVAAGIIPLMFYVAYWVQAIWAALCAPDGKTHGVPSHLPLVVYAFLICFATARKHIAESHNEAVVIRTFNLALSGGARE